VPRAFCSYYCQCKSQVSRRPLETVLPLSNSVILEGIFLSERVQALSYAPYSLDLARQTSGIS
jgi:hypothetical protein